MQKRAIAAVLWFAAVWVTYEVIWSVTGLPRMLGPIMAATAAILVVVDPTDWFWGRAGAQRRERPAVPVMSGRVEQPS